FSQTLDPSGTFSTSPSVVGKVYAANYTTPTPANLLTAVSNEATAYNDAHGLYKWTTGVTVSGTVTLNGGPSDVFIFQVTGTLTFAASANIVLTGGARACNVIWQAASQVTLSGGAASQ